MKEYERGGLFVKPGILKGEGLVYRTELSPTPPVANSTSRNS